MRNILFILLCLSVCPKLLFAQVPAGNIAAYSMNNSANDMGSNGYNGTLTGTSATANRLGTANLATAFTAGTSAGTLPAAFATALSNDFSIGYWFKTTMTAPTNAMWYSGVSLVDAEVCGATNDWGTALIDGGKVAMGIGNPDITIKSPLATYNDGLWHFVTATRNMAAGVIILYIDGAQVATTSGTNTGALSAPNLVGLGRNPCVASGVFTGSLDDMIAYNRVLTATEVGNLYAFYNINALPLKWKSFTGRVEEGQVYLQWETENAVNNDRFEIERSTDGTRFSVIGTLQDAYGNGQLAVSAAYTFTDVNPSKGDDYYRIRQVDKDGSYTWSAILRLSLNNPSTALHLQTNPVTDEATLVNNDLLLIQRMQVMDISGRVLLDQAVYSNNSLLKINTRRLGPGYYLLSVRSGTDHRTMRFVKL
jgi:hypothetical protein